MLRYGVTVVRFGAHRRQQYRPPPDSRISTHWLWTSRRIGHLGPERQVG